METIKNLFTDAVKMAVMAALACAALLFSAGNAEAQRPGVQVLLGTTGATNLFWIPANTTNAYVFATYGTNGSPFTTNVFNNPANLLSPNTNLLEYYVGDFDFIGVSYGFTGTATSTNDLLIVASYDNGNTFQTNTPLLSYSNIWAGSGVGWFTNQQQDIHGITHIALILRNRGTTPVTNLLFEVTGKANKVQTLQATH